MSASLENIAHPRVCEGARDTLSRLGDSFQIIYIENQLFSKLSSHAKNVKFDIFKEAASCAELAWYVLRADRAGVLVINSAAPSYLGLCLIAVNLINKEPQILGHACSRCTPPRL